MYLNIIFLPLAGALVVGFFGRKFGPKGCSLLSTCCAGFTFLTSLFVFYEVGLQGSPCYIHLTNWIDTEFFSVSWGFLFDSLTAIMLVIISFISTLVHFYSVEYMQHDPHLNRFMCYLSMFTFFMLILVTADNFIQMFVGWEGVGLCSYLLINFWFTRIQANKAAIKAMTLNKIGDFGLSLGIFTIYYVFNSVNYFTVFSLVTGLLDHSLVFFGIKVDSFTFIGVFLFIGAVGKSAQIGLHVWLPDAMEGPTPVSALIHAATMVTAGIFLLGRCSPIFEYTPSSLVVITFFGAFTCFFASSVGLVQNDLKRIIAYSTCSQLGYMIFACGLSHYSVGVFHLFNHAFFKALLFLGAGSVIHAVSDEQDIRKMGGLKKIIPFTYAVMLIGSFSLMGMPFLTGFYSKDVILEVAYSKFSVPGHFSYWLGSIGAFFTSFYSTRLLYLTFLGKCNGYRFFFLNINDAAPKMFLVLTFLVLPSIFIGYLTKDMIIGLGSNFWGNALFILPKNLVLIDSEFICIYNKVLAVFLSLSGGAFSYFFYYCNYKKLYLLKVGKIGRVFYKFLNRKWFFDKIYNELAGQFFLDFGYSNSYKRIDKGFIEMLGPYGISSIVFAGVKSVRDLHGGNTYHHTLAVVTTISIFIDMFLLVIFTNSCVDLRLLLLFLFLFNSLRYPQAVRFTVSQHEKGFYKKYKDGTARSVNQLHVLRCQRPGSHLSISLHLFCTDAG